MFRNKYSGMSIIGPDGMERDLSRRGRVRGTARVDPRRGLPGAEGSFSSARSSSGRMGGFMSGARERASSARSSISESFANASRRTHIMGQTAMDTTESGIRSMGGRVRQGISGMRGRMFGINMQGFGGTSGVSNITGIAIPQASSSTMAARGAATDNIMRQFSALGDSSAFSSLPTAVEGQVVKAGRKKANVGFAQAQHGLNRFYKRGGEVNRVAKKASKDYISRTKPVPVPVTMGATRPKTPFKGLEASVATSEAKAMERATRTPISISGVRQGGKMRPLKAPAPTPKPKSSFLGGVGDFFMKEGKMTTRGKIGLGVAAAVAAGVVMNRRDKGVRPAGPGGY